MIRYKLKRLSKKLEKILLKTPRFGEAFFYTYNDEGIRLKHMLTHKSIKGYPMVEGKVEKDIIPTKQDYLVTERLLNSYKKAMQEGEKIEKVYKQDMWTFLEKGPHADMFKILQKEDVNALAFYLCNMSRMGITHGITQGKMEFQKIITDSLYRRWHDLHNLDKLISLAESIGVLPLENPEQGEFGSAIFSNIDKIIEKIEKRLKIKLIPPHIEGGLYQLSTNKGGIHFRDLNAIYTSWRCKEILKYTKNPSLCEIGAGVGKTAYYSNLLGLKAYTIIDLPYINIIQGFYLIKSLPSANIFLYGEEKNDKNSINILPDWCFKKMYNKQFNLILNQDSFPEIDRKIVLNYLKQIQLLTKNFFLSINQESQHTMMIDERKQHIISNLISEAKGFKKIYRFPYWMRIGYLEELYQVME